MSTDPRPQIGPKPRLDVAPTFAMRAMPRVAHAADDGQFLAVPNGIGAARSAAALIRAQEGQS